MVKEDIETVIDRLLEFIRVNNKVKLTEASSALGLTPAQVEKLVLLLEDSGLIQVNYSLFGVELVYLELPSGEEKAKLIQAKIEASKAIQESHLLEHEVMTSDNLLRFFEKDVGRRIALSEKLLSDLEKSGSFTKEELLVVKKEIDLALGQLDHFKNEVQKLVEKEDEFRARLLSFRSRLGHFKGRAEKRAALVAKQRRKQPAFSKYFHGIGNSLKLLARRITQIMASIAPSVKGGKRRRVSGPLRRVLVTRRDRVREHYWKKVAINK